MRSVRPQTVTLAVLAILFGLGAVWVAKQVLLARQEQPVVQAAPAPPPAVDVLVLQSNLVADARIREQDVGQVPVPLEVMKMNKVPLEKIFRYKQQAMGRILKHAMLAGSTLSEDDFYPVGQGPRLKLKEGLRAVTVRVDDPAISSDIIRTGCLVDVIFTTENPDDLTKLTRRLVSGLEVLSPPVTEGGVPNSLTSVTLNQSSKKSYVVLAATPEQVDRLALAQQMDGTISVALCAVPGEGEQPTPNRVNVIPTNGDYQVTERELLNLPPPAAAPAQPERIVIEQIRGNKVDYVVFTGDDERLTEEKALQDSLPASAKAAGAKPVKKCKTCGKKKRGGEPTPAPSTTPSPTPAIPDFRNGPRPSNPVPVSPATT